MQTKKAKSNKEEIYWTEKGGGKRRRKKGNVERETGETGRKKRAEKFR